MSEASHPDPLAVDLDPLVDKIAAREIDPGLLRRRGRYRRIEPWIPVAGTTALIAVLAASGDWRVGAALALLLLPMQVGGVLERQDELRGLESDADWVEFESRLLAAELRHLRFTALTYLALGIGLAVAAAAGHHPIPVGVVALGIGARGLFLAMRRLPRARRDLHAFGVAEPAAGRSWWAALLVLCLALVYPILLVIGLIRDAWRAIFGRGGDA